MQLKQVIEKLGIANVVGPVGREVSGISYDIRAVQPGCLFVAVARDREDGHDCIDEAIARGAVAIICERNGSIKQRATKVEVPRSAEALAIVASCFYEEPARKLKMIGVVGNSGQTSLAYGLRDLLERAGLRTGLIGSIHHQIGDRVFPFQRHYSESLDVQKLLRQMVNAGCSTCVVEIGGQSLRNDCFFGIDFQMIISAGMVRDSSYSADKDFLGGALRQWVRKARQACVVNVDDPVGSQISSGEGAGRFVTYALEGEAQISASNVQLYPTGSRFDLRIGSQVHTCGIPQVGRRSVQATMGAIAGALTAGIPFARVQPLLYDLTGAPGHLEAVSQGQLFSVFIDHADCEEQFAAVLREVREICRRHVIVVFGCEGERHAEKRFRMGQIAADAADYTFITADNPRNEPIGEITREVEEGYRSIRSDGYVLEEDRANAIAEAFRLAEPGDCVLIAGKGHHAYQEFEDTIIPFDDREYAREALALGGNQSLVSETLEPEFASC